jgi:hypothetical protein
MSPGSFPKQGIFPAKEKIKPRKIKIPPIKIKIFPKNSIIRKFFLGQIFWLSVLPPEIPLL